MNTKVTIEYSNGDKREFIASDRLEKMILDGQMFSVITCKADTIDEELQLSKMYVGNPIAALGFMIKLHQNALQLAIENGDEIMNNIAGVVGRCVAMLSDEVTSHQSSMTDPRESV